MRANRIALAFFLLLAGGCSTVQTHVDDSCDPPPIPPELLEPCEEPQPLLDGRLATVYQSQLADLGPWGRCIRKDDKLVEVVKYRDAFCARLKEKIRTDAAAKPWWKFWGS